MQQLLENFAFNVNNSYRYQLMVCIGLEYPKHPTTSNGPPNNSFCEPVKEEIE